MKILCTTGSTEKQTQAIAEVLKHAGVKSAKPSLRDSALNMQEWHEKVSLRQQTGSPIASQSLGKLWEQLAADIFMANMDEPVWGWVDSHSLSLLDFWTSFDPEIRFILCTSSPEQAIAEAILDTETALDIDGIMEEWHQSHQAMLRFHLRNPELSILVDVNEALAMPELLINKINQDWHTELDASGQPRATNNDAIPHYLARELGKELTALHELQEEIIASRLPFPPTGGTCSDLSKVLEHYRSLLTLQAEQNYDLQHARKLQEQSKESLELNQQALSALQLDIQEQLQQTASLKHQYQQQEEENELLLNQLHQVQEELENLFLKNRQYETQIQQQEIKLQEFQQLAKTRTSELDQVKLQLDSRNNEINTLKTAADETSKKVKTLQKQQDATLAELQKSQQSCKQLQADLSKANTVDETKHQELQEENDLLLAQLHQVQEELENYFLKYRESHLQLEQAEKRWARLQHKLPDYIDYQSITATLGKNDKVEWTVEQLHAAGRSFEKLTFVSTIENGIAGFIFRKQEVGSSLTRWPVCAGALDELAIVPVGSPESIKLRTLILQELSTSDLALLKVLAKLIIQALPTLPLGTAPEKLDSALQNFLQIMEQISHLLRYDQAKLLSTETNQGYEHLWFRLDNLSYQGQHYEQFDFRLACAIVKPGVFGEHPRFEFPKAEATTPLNSWFAESHDEFGPKLELRFAAPDAMDINVWKKLSHADQQFLRALFMQLDNILHQQEHLGEAAGRDWNEWRQTHQTILQILNLCAPVHTQPITA